MYENTFFVYEFVFFSFKFFSSSSLQNDNNDTKDQLYYSENW